MTGFVHNLLTIGRVSMDLFALDIGADFKAITGFETGVGGSPVNIAIGSKRLGLPNVVTITAVSDDEVGRFVKHYLHNEGINTDYIATIPDTRTGMAVVGVQPPDRFPLVFYREHPADIHVTLDHVVSFPISETQSVLLSGTALSRGSIMDVTLYVAEQAQVTDTTVFLDLDLRPDQWRHPLAYGLFMRRLMPLCDVIIGTEEEFYSALAPDPRSVMHGQKLIEDQKAGLDRLLDKWWRDHSKILMVKRGAQGVQVFDKGKTYTVSGFPVTVLNTIGAGDAFASGLIYGYSHEWDWYKSARFANACGAIVVTRHGCARAMPYLNEVNTFIENNGGY